MNKIFVCSDHHFGHKNIIKFTDEHGNKHRNFNNIDEMHEHIITQHNLVVSNNDIVYFLGDVAFNKKYLPLLNLMNGKQFILVKGNHDKFEINEYIKYFDDICGIVKKWDMVLTHTPIHPDSLDRWKLNVHGHLHSKNILLPNGYLDKKYYNVSLENINFVPVDLDHIRTLI